MLLIDGFSVVSMVDIVLSRFIDVFRCSFAIRVLVMESGSVMSVAVSSFCIVWSVMS